MYTFQAIVQNEGFSGIFNSKTINDRFTMISPLMFPFRCGRIYDKKKELNKDHVEFLKKLLNDNFDSFFRNYIEFSFEYVEVRKI